MSSRVSQTFEVVRAAEDPLERLLVQHVLESRVQLLFGHRGGRDVRYWESVWVKVQGLSVDEGGGEGGENGPALSSPFHFLRQRPERCPTQATICRSEVLPLRSQDNVALISLLLALQLANEQRSAYGLRYSDHARYRCVPQHMSSLNLLIYTYKESTVQIVPTDCDLH
jgi:hypothetical protein